MKRVIGRAAGLVILALALSAVAASAQDRLVAAPVAPKLRFSLEGAAGLHVYYRGSMQTIAFGFAPTRSLTLLVSAERWYVADEIERYEDGPLKPLFRGNGDDCRAVVGLVDVGHCGRVHVGRADSHLADRLAGKAQ